MHTVKRSQNKEMDGDLEAYLRKRVCQTVQRLSNSFEGSKGLINLFCFAVRAVMDLRPGLGEKWN